VNVFLEKMNHRVFGIVFLVLLAVLVLMFATDGSRAAWAAELPPSLTVNEVERVDFSRADTDYLPLFPDIPEDREKIERLVQLYNRAAASLAEEGQLEEEPLGIFFMNRITISLSDGSQIIMVLDLQNGVSFYTKERSKSRQVTDPEVSRELRETAQTYFIPAQGTDVDPRVLRLGEQVTVRSDSARGKEAQILIMPSYWPVTIPSAPAPYPVPEAILLATVPVEHDRFSYTFTLEKQMGQRMDGSPGEIGPGAWELVVVSGGQTMIPLTILPSRVPEPRAVIYDRGKVFTWNKTKGVISGVLADPSDQPLLISESKWGSPITHVSPNFLQDWLEIPIDAVAPGSFRVGSPEMGLTVSEGEDFARVNGTMLSLRMPPTFRGTWRLPWWNLARFFDYRVQWLGPGKVVFLRNLDEIPVELREALVNEQSTSKRGRKISVTIGGKNFDISDGRAYLDPDRGRVMVPLRATVEALGGKVNWFPLVPEFEEKVAPDHNFGLPPRGDMIKSYVDVGLGSKSWRVYLTPKTNDTTMVPLRQLALALGYQLSWDASLERVQLRTEK